MCSTDISRRDDKSVDRIYDDDESSSEYRVSVTDRKSCDSTRTMEEHVAMIDQTGVCHKTETNDSHVSIIDLVSDNRKRKPQNAASWSTVSVGLPVVMLVALSTWTVR